MPLRSLALLVVMLPALASAAPHPHPLELLSSESIRKLAPVLRGGGDLALIESTDKGALKQITCVTLVAAPAEQVRDAVIHPERYGEFVRNMKESTVTAEVGGTMKHQYTVSYGIYTVEGRHRFVMLPKEHDDEPAPVQMYDPDDNGVRHYRWQFVPVPEYGATLLVLYGYTEIPRDTFLNRFLVAAKPLEHGLALITQMTLVLSMKQRAEETAGHPALKTVPGARGSYSSLLERGTVALFRTAGGRLSDLSLIDRTAARPEVMIKVVAEPGSWSQFVPTIARSTNVTAGGNVGVEVEQSLPLVSWTTAYAYRSDLGSSDMFALSGDLRGGRLRWDVRSLGTRTEVVLRLMQRYDAGSIVVKQLYKLEPFFEYGINVGLGLVLLEGVRTHAEELSRKNP